MVNIAVPSGTSGPLLIVLHLQGRISRPSSWSFLHIVLVACFPVVQGYLRSLSAQASGRK
jgi:hypothetical protein